MQCPFCRAPDTRVIDSRLAEEGEQIRRRRECERCGQRFTTFEKAQLLMPSVIKRSGDVEPFKEENLRKGMASACFKRPVTDEQIDHAVDSVMRKLRHTGEREVPSRQIGEWVMDELHQLDPVAYVRFASIYREFKDANAFVEEVSRLAALPTAEERKSQLPLIKADDDTGA